MDYFALRAFTIRPTIRTPMVFKPSNDDISLLCLEGQLVAEIRMRHGEHGLDALRQCLAAQFGNTIFCNDVVHVVFAGRDDCAFCERGFDPVSPVLNQPWRSIGAVTITSASISIYSLNSAGISI